MTRRHKSSKRSSRDTRDYSDSEKESGLKDRRGKEDSSGVRVLKDSGSSEKRKLDSKDTKDVFDSGNGDHAEEYSSSLKRRKDRADGGVSDRWNGGGEDDRTEGSRKSKAPGESRSKRRDENEEPRSRSEGKHRESGRRESREVERERERKGKEGKIEKFSESEELIRVPMKSINEKIELSAHDLLPSPEPENQLERRVRRRRGSSGDRDKYEVDIGDMDDRRNDDVTNDGRPKDEKHKDERYRDKYRDDLEKDSRHRDDKLTRDHNGIKSDAKHSRDDKSAAENRQRKSKPQDSDRDREREYDNDHDYDFEREFDAGRDRDHYRERDRGRDRSRDRGRNRDHDVDRDWDRERNRDLERERDRDRDVDRRDRDRERERERDRDRDRNRERDRDLDHDLDRDFDHDGSHIDERSMRHKDSRGRKRSPDERDDCIETKSRGTKVHHTDMEIRSLSSNRIETDADRGRSQSRQGYLDSTISSNRRRTSASPSSHGGADDYRHSKQDDLKHRDSATGKAISSREVTGFSGASERGSKYRSSERAHKVDDSFPGDLLIERSSSSKASPRGMAERSPSSTSLERRYMGRSGTRRSIDVEDTGRRNSIGPRESATTEDRLSRDVPLEKPLGDESSQMDLMFYNRTSQSNSSSALPPPPNFRGGIGSPSFMGSMEEDGRVNVGSRYRRGGDPNMGRGQSNMWRGAPNWSSSLPNGFIPFQHGPPPGGFQAMMPQFPSPSLFNVRPSMEINHSGIPYHIPDADRFSGHMRPLGWQNMMEGSGPSHLHGWDGNNGVFRDEPLMYGGSDWDQNRHMMTGRGWEAGADLWKGENGDANMDLPASSQKEDQHPLQPPLEDCSSGKGSDKTQHESKKQGVGGKSVETTPVSSPNKEFSKVVSPKTADDKTTDPSKMSTIDHVALRCRFYLSKLDISAELAGTEVYSQCLNFLDMEQNAIDEKDTDMIINLKEGGIAVPKSSKILLTPPFFPAASESVFQRAMDHYKKQRVQMNGFGFVNGEKLNTIASSDPQKVVQGCPADGIPEESVLVADAEMSIDPKTTSELNKEEALPNDDVMETLEEQKSTAANVVPDLPITPPQNPELPEKTPDEQPLQTSDENNKMDDTMTAEQVIPEEIDADRPSPFENASAVDASLTTEGDDKEDETIKTKSDDNVVDNAVEEMEQTMKGSGDGNSGKLLKSDASSPPPEVADEAMLMPESIESVILSNSSSRIHHSPESTH